MKLGFLAQLPVVSSSDGAKTVSLIKRFHLRDSLNNLIKFAIILGDNLHEVTAKVVQNPKCDNVTTLCADVLSNLDACRVCSKYYIEL